MRALSGLRRGVIAFGLAACNAISGTTDYSIVSPQTLADEGGAEAVDGASPVIPVTGQIDASVPVVPDGKVEMVAPDGLDFGSVDCGVSPAPRRVEIRNSSPEDVTFVAAMTKATSFSVVPTEGAVPSGAVFLLSISSPGAPKTDPPAAYDDQLTVTTTAKNDAPHVFDVKMGTQGAIFTITPSLIDFGHTTSTKYKVITIRNDGNVDGIVELDFTTNDYKSFSVDPSEPSVLAPGTSEERKITARPPKSGSPTKKGTLALVSSSPFCAAALPKLSLSAFNND